MEPRSRGSPVSSQPTNNSRDSWTNSFRTFEAKDFRERSLCGRPLPLLLWLSRSIVTERSRFRSLPSIKGWSHVDSAWNINPAATELARIGKVEQADILRAV